MILLIAATLGAIAGVATAAKPELARVKAKANK